MTETAPSCVHRTGCLDPSRCRGEGRCCSLDIRRHGPDLPVEGSTPRPDAGAREGRTDARP